MAESVLEGEILELCCGETNRGAVDFLTWEEHSWDKGAGGAVELEECVLGGARLTVHIVLVLATLTGSGFWESHFQGLSQTLWLKGLDAAITSRKCWWSWILPAFLSPQRCLPFDHRIYFSWFLGSVWTHIGQEAGSKNGKWGRNHSPAVWVSGDGIHRRWRRGHFHSYQLLVHFGSVVSKLGQKGLLCQGRSGKDFLIFLQCGSWDLTKDIFLKKVEITGASIWWLLTPPFSPLAVCGIQYLWGHGMPWVTIGCHQPREDCAGGW